MGYGDAAWYKMNYPRTIDKNWYKKESELKHLQPENPKETHTLFQRETLIKPVNLRGELDDIMGRKEPAPGQFHHLQKPSTRVLTTTPADYQRQMIVKTNVTSIHGEDLANVMPISNTIPKEKKVDSKKEYQDLIWNYEEAMKKKIPVDYVSEEARHYAVSFVHPESRQRNPHAAKPAQNFG